jgi:hypothetical protein
VKQLTEGHVEWTTAAPLWPQTGDPTLAENRLKFRRPSILRFATDTFMDDFHNLLNTAPHRLSEFVAVPETWTSPPNEPAITPQKSGMALKLQRARDFAVRRLQARGNRVIGEISGAVKPKVLKLYQPVHQRYYMVTTCLVCRTLGLPDRRIDAGAQERATFVLRLLQPHANADAITPDPRDCDELALVNGQWLVLNDPAIHVDGEEQHALAPAAYTEDDQRKRRLLVALIPVADRERLLQAVQPNPAGAGPLPPMVDARQMLLKTQVIGPISNLEDLANITLKATQPNPRLAALTGPEETIRLGAAAGILLRGNNQIQQSSFYILLDLAHYFETHLNVLWQAIYSGDGSNLRDPLKPIWDTLSAATYSGITMVEALRRTYDAASTIESMKSVYPNPDGAMTWPTFKFQFHNVTTVVQSLPGLGGLVGRARFETQIVNALPFNPPNPFPARLVAQANANPQGPAWFTIRCILERPNCGALTPPLVSEPTVAFQLSAYFDPDAPARPIRIGLPIDTTPAGLRKFDKNTAFVMSDTLCGQVKKMGGMSFGDLIMSVLPFPFHQDLDSGGGTPCGEGGVAWGMVCSFSIPIITIVALILLIIFVKLLDIIFFWMPFFQICLPLPKFSAKES